MTLEIKSKVSKQGLRAGKTLYYAYPTKREKLRIDQVMEQISSICSLSRIDVESALRAFAEVVCTSFEQGIGVDLGEIGTLMPFRPRQADEHPRGGHRSDPPACEDHHAPEEEYPPSARPHHLPDQARAQPRLSKNKK